MLSTTPVVSSSLLKLGGISFIASGSLFLVQRVLEIMIGPPPSRGAEILTWMTSHQLALGLVDEVLFFAIIFLVPAVIALRASFAAASSTSGVVGCGIIAVTIPVLATLLVVQGRLAFPVYQIRVHTAEVAELVVALYYGGMHAVALLFAAATCLLSLAIRRSPNGRTIAYLGFVTAAFDVIDGYPWAIPRALWLTSGAVFSAWFIMIGMRLLRTSPAAVPG